MSQLITGPTSQPEVLPTEPTFFDPQQRAELSAAVFTEFGLPADVDVFAERYSQLHQNLAAEHPEGDLEVEPFMPIILDEKFGFEALLARYDQKSEDESYLYMPVMQQYGPGALNSRSRQMFYGAEAERQAAAANSARAMILGGDPEESGLFAKDLDVVKQIPVAKAAAIGYNGMHDATWLEGLNPVDYVILNAQRRQEGETLLDADESYTAFVQLPPVDADKSKWIASADNHTRMLWFNGVEVSERVGPMQRDFGMRFTVRATE